MRFIVSQVISFVLGVIVAIAVMREINPNLIQGEETPHKRDPQQPNSGPPPQHEHNKAPQDGQSQKHTPQKEGPKKHPHKER